MAERQFTITGSPSTFSLRALARALPIPRWDKGLVWVVAIAMGTVVLHLATGWRYGFDRDELMALDDARHLAWGYVQYPPMLPFFARIALLLFGTSLVGFRFFAAVVQAGALVFTGLMAREIAGGISEQANPNTASSGQQNGLSISDRAALLATLAGVPFCLGGGALMQYISFDYFCWVLVAYCMVRLLKSDDARWWLAVGAAIGLGLMAKYTMGFLFMGVAAGALLTSARKYLRSGWLWAGALSAVAITLPNLWWQWKRHFIALEFLRFIHARDMRVGLTDWFVPSQLELTMLAFPLAIAGLWFCFFSERGERYRALGWMYLVPLVLFVIMRGRNYYLAPAYPMLYASGSVWLAERLNFADSEHSVARTSSIFRNWASLATRALWIALLLDVGAAAAVSLPIAPVNSRWWNLAIKVDGVFPEEIGWPEFVETVAGVRDRLPLEDQHHVAILAGNYGELGALNLYGERYGLPQAISGENSSWERGYGRAGADTVIVTGYQREFLQQHFASCELAAHYWNRYAVNNEESTEDPDIFVCRGRKESWRDFWPLLRKFG
jgi:Dolichyl-phosphate-mannose-protein mannosyltransferase